MTRETKEARRERLQRQKQALQNDASPGRRALYLCGECNVLHWVTCLGIGSFDPTLWLTARIVVSVVISEWWQKFIVWDYAYPLLFTIGFTLAGALIGWIGGVEAARH